MPKKKDNRTWFQKVSRGGKRFIDLSNPYNLKHLTAKELQYLNFQRDMHRYNVHENTLAYRQKGVTRFEKMGLIAAQQRLMKGVEYRKALNNYGEAYAQGLRFNGYSEIADIFEKVYGKMNYNDKYNWSLNDLPELPIFYKIKGKAEASKNDVEPKSAEYAMKSAAMNIVIEALDRFGVGEILSNKQLLNMAFGLSREDIEGEALDRNKSVEQILREKLPWNK